MADRVYLAADFGASGGRLMAARFDGSRLTLETVHRFDNGPVRVGPRLYWDLLRLWSELREGLQRAGARFGACAHSLGVDAWGVDFALLGPGGELLGNPRHYRDSHTVGILDRAFQVVPRAEIFARTGLQFLPFNTLYQLWALREAGSPLLDRAERLLLIPDVFHWLLTGRPSNEYTNATTTQLFDPTTGHWATGLLEPFGLPEGILGDIQQPGTPLGPISGWLAEESGLGALEVVLPGTHDTASAVAAVPADAPLQDGPDWCYISSGTWSLLGAELPQPVVTERCLALNFTNEGGVGRSTRLLKNIAGLWIVQECRRMWGSGGRNPGWPELAAQAAAAPGGVSRIDPDHEDFVAPDDMPEAVRGYCRRSGQPVPESQGAVIRCALESLAEKCRATLEGLESLCGSRFRTIHVVGGGSQNELLCQLTADACGRRVLAGPVEATALGNVLVQMMADGAIANLSEGRRLVGESYRPVAYEPQSG